MEKDNVWQLQDEHEAAVKKLKDAHMNAPVLLQEGHSIAYALGHWESR